LSEFSIRLAWDSKTSHAPVNDKDFDHHIIEIVHPHAAGDRDSIFELFLPESLPLRIISLQDGFSRVITSC
jgi:hypothetical protein